MAPGSGWPTVVPEIGVWCWRSRVYHVWGRLTVGRSALGRDRAIAVAVAAHGLDHAGIDSRVAQPAAQVAHVHLQLRSPDVVVPDIGAELRGVDELARALGQRFEQP